MLSLETAKRLKEAGLQHDLGYGDYVYNIVNDISFIMSGPPYDEIKEYLLWLPRLDQLLGEIKASGWEYALYSDNTIEIETDKESIPAHLWFNIFVADAPDEAAAKALLWILERKKGCDT